MCSDAGEGSKLCMIYSVTGALFTLWVGLLLTYQPFFVGGIKDVEVAKGSAFGAMYTFVVTFGISVLVWIRDARRKRREQILSRHTYTQVTQPPPLPGLHDYEVNIDLPSLSGSESMFGGELQSSQHEVRPTTSSHDVAVGNLLD